VITSVADEHFRTVSEYFDDPKFVTNVKETFEPKSNKRKRNAYDSDADSWCDVHDWPENETQRVGQESSHHHWEPIWQYQAEVWRFWGTMAWEHVQAGKLVHLRCWSVQLQQAQEDETRMNTVSFYQFIGIDI
jgi:hypothetical protein